MIKTNFIEVFRESEQESDRFRNSEPSKQFDFKVLIISITVAFSLTIFRYCSSYKNSILFLKNFFDVQWVLKINDIFETGQFAQLFRLSHWFLILSICYIFIPIFTIKFFFKDSLKKYGLSFKNSLKDYKIYLLLIALIIPIVFAVSYTKSFQATYPFYKLKHNEPIDIKFLIWELEYLAHFFAVEFFFRGFIIHGLKHRFGYYSVFVLIIPYCMIHFSKPMPETIAAIIAGFILGTLSLKSRNIYLGFFIHCSVAITMDLCALWQKGLLI